MNNKPVYKTPASKQEIMALYNAVLDRRPVAHQSLTRPQPYPPSVVIPLSSPVGKSLLRH